MEQQSVFLSSTPISNGLYHIITNELSRGPCTNSLEDLKAMVTTLSTIASTCESVLSDSEQEQNSDASKVLEEIGNVLTWTKFLDTIKTTTEELSPSEPEYLFRAHKYAGTTSTTFTPDLDIPFDLGLRRIVSFDEFIVDLANHLGKTQKEEGGEKIETYFVSMSPILEWTIHTVGKKKRKITQDEDVGLAIFDVKKLRQNSRTTIFRVSHVLEFLISQGKDFLIPAKAQKWARNCDEYVSVGKIPDNGLVRWVTWAELSSPSVTILPACFFRAYTLALYRNWIEDQCVELEVEDVCNRILNFGKALAGPQDDLLLPLIKLVLKPGIGFWGMRTATGDDAIESRTHIINDDTALDQFSTLRL